MNADCAKPFPHISRLVNAPNAIEPLMVFGKSMEPMQTTNPRGFDAPDFERKRLSLEAPHAAQKSLRVPTRSSSLIT